MKISYVIAFFSFTWGRTKVRRFFHYISFLFLPFTNWPLFGELTSLPVIVYRIARKSHLGASRFQNFRGEEPQTPYTLRNKGSLKQPRIFTQHTG
jgi:hypothetical protein